jgi:hypothetical protein
MKIKDYAGEEIDTREESARPGPYCDGMSVLLHELDSEDEARGDFCVYGTGRRFGRRVLWCDTQGFMVTQTYATADEASEALNAWADQCDDETEEF